MKLIYQATKGGHASPCLHLWPVMCVLRVSQNSVLISKYVLHLVEVDWSTLTEDFSVWHCIMSKSLANEKQLLLRQIKWNLIWSLYRDSSAWVIKWHNILTKLWSQLVGYPEMRRLMIHSWFHYYFCSTIAIRKNISKFDELSMQLEVHQLMYLSTFIRIIPQHWNINSEIGVCNLIKVRGLETSISAHQMSS